MNTWKAVIAAISISIGCLFYPQTSFAEGFTGKDFAGWSVESQNSYIQSSLTMAGVVLTQTHPGVATCVNDWYFAGQTLTAQNDAIRETIVRYDDAHPAGVLMALILQNCGPLD